LTVADKKQKYFPVTRAGAVPILFGIQNNEELTIRKLQLKTAVDHLKDIDTVRAVLNILETILISKSKEKPEPKKTKPKKIKRDTTPYYSSRRERRDSEPCIVI